VRVKQSNMFTEVSKECPSSPSIASFLGLLDPEDEGTKLPFDMMKSQISV